MPDLYFHLKILTWDCDAWSELLLYVLACAFANESG